jgi:hypothetical protein
MTEAVYPHLETLQNLDVPDDLGEAVRKLELFVIRRRYRNAESYWLALQDGLQDHERRDTISFYVDVHFRIVRLLLRCVRLQFAQEVLEDIPEEHREDRRYRDLYNLLNHYLAADSYRSYFPLNVEWDTRFEGPHMLDSENDEGEPLVRWLAGRVDSKDGDTLYTRIVDPTAEEGPAEGRLDIPLTTLAEWSTDRVHEEVEEGDFFEAGIYGNEDEIPRIRFWGRKWDGWERLTPLRIDPQLYLRAAGWVVGGQTFMERCVRGEIDPDAIDSYVDQWHDGASSYDLPDYLGMLPEEYARWVEDARELEGIIEERQQKWEAEGRL